MAITPVLAGFTLDKFPPRVCQSPLSQWAYTVYLSETEAGMGDMDMGMAVADMRSWSAADFGLMFAAVNRKRRLIRRRAVFLAG